MAAAMTGTFGFELDLSRYSAEELAELRPYVEFYRAHGALLRGGDLYRLCPPDGTGAAWAIAAPDGGEAVVFAVGAVLDGRSLPLPFVRPGRYAVCPWPGAPECPEAQCSGESLAAHGLSLPALRGDLPGYACWIQKR